MNKTFLRKPLMSLSLAQKCYGIDKTTFYGLNTLGLAIANGAVN